MTREDALEKLQEPAYDVNTIAHDFEYIATKLGITVDELKGYMDAPNKSYRDYKSQMNVFVWGIRILKALGIERRVMR